MVQWVLTDKDTGLRFPVSAATLEEAHTATGLRMGDTYVARLS